MSNDALVPSTADRLGVFDLFARYAWALDTADRDAFLQCFARDGELVQASGSEPMTFRGHDQIEEFFTDLTARPDFAGRQHHVGQSTFSALPQSGQFAVRSYFFVSELHPQSSPILFFTGYYDDICVQEGSSWVFLRRKYDWWRGDVLDRFAVNS